MGTLRKYDVGVFPAFMCKGRQARDQVILTYLWMVAGDEWTYKGLSEMCGCGVNTALLDGLVREGVLSETNEDNRKNTRPCNKYRINVDFVPDRPEEPVEAPKVKLSYPGWIWTCKTAWEASQGITWPSSLLKALGPAIEIHGEKKVVDAFVSYARRADKKFNPSPWQFARNINRWMRPARDEVGSASMRDLL